MLQQLEQQGGPLQNLTPPDNVAPPLPPFPVLPPRRLDPLLTPAVSPEGHHLLENVCAKWNAISLESCNGCEREWFDLNGQQLENRGNLCKDCRKPRPLFHEDNDRYPGPGCPDLPKLTQMLILPIHQLIQVGC